MPATNPTITEEWRAIPRFPEYEASSLGRIRSTRRRDRIGRSIRPRILRNARDSGRGYLFIRLAHDGKTVTVGVHRLVLEAFEPQPSPKHQCCHSDGDKKNNALANLRWGTSRENNRDKITHGTIARGSRNGFAKLSEATVSLVKTLYAAGVTLSAMAPFFGVNRETLGRAVRGTYWRHVRPLSLDGVTYEGEDLLDELVAASRDLRLMKFRGAPDVARCQKSVDLRLAVATVHADQQSK